MKIDKEKILDRQNRSFMEGTIEIFNNDWIFFDDEGDDAFPLDQFVGKEVSVLRNNKWKKGILTDHMVLHGEYAKTPLLDQDKIRVQKNLLYSFQLLLQQLDDGNFLKFIEQLNQLDFSVYDCIYCHNQLSYELDQKKAGVNFIIFDNHEILCSVQHHYNGLNQSNRFEYTVNTGERYILQSIEPPHKI